MTVTTAQELDMRHIAERIQSELAGQPAVAEPQADDCATTYVVPVTDELERRIMRLLDSLALQDGAEQTEVILVVNNAPDDGSAGMKRRMARNRAVMDLPVYRGRQRVRAIDDSSVASFIRRRLAVHCIDQSSPGLWVPGNNAGTARQRGLLESAMRFAQRGVNGLITHTDADCWYENPEFGGKVRWLFRQNPRLLALAGTYFPELDLNDPEAEGLAEHIELYKLYRRYDRLYRDITRGWVDLNFNDNIMLGSCTTHRALEGYLCGGIPPINLCEDVAFSDNLKTYAEAYDMYVDHGRRWGLGPVTAFRISERTGASISHRFEKLGKSGQIYVDDAFNPGTQVLLTQEYLQRMIEAVRQMPNGLERLEYLFLMSPLCHFRITRS